MLLQPLHTARECGPASGSLGAVLIDAFRIRAEFQTRLRGCGSAKHGGAGLHGPSTLASHRKDEQDLNSLDMCNDKAVDRVSDVYCLAFSFTLLSMR